MADELMVRRVRRTRARVRRYYEGRDYCSRKQKGAIDLSQATEVRQVEIEGGAGLVIDTPGRQWELLPLPRDEPNCRKSAREEAVDWYRMLCQLLARKRGLAVVSSVGNLSLEAEDEASKPGELTVLLQRKLGMSINKLGNEIVIAELEPDGAAAACGLLSVGDALDEVNAAKTESCRQTIKLLMANPAAAQLKLFSKVVHGGWMHKLGEGLGGWTTRYFTLTYELDPHAVPKPAGAGNTDKVSMKLDAKRERPRATSIAATGGSSMVLVHLHKANRADKLGLSLAEDHDGQVVIQRIYDGYVAASSAALLVGDVLVAVNGKEVANQPMAYQYLAEASGPMELKVHRAQESGCWMLRYYDGKNSVTRHEKGCIPLNRGSVREINKYTLQDDAATDGDVPRVGLYILQDERCWELLPPEEELDMWTAKLQLAVFGQEVIAAEYVTPEKASTYAAKVRDLKGAHYLTLQQQYGLMLATYKDKHAATPAASGAGAASGAAAAAASNEVYIMSMEMDGAGACSGLLFPDDRVIEVDGVPAESLQQVTTAFRESRDTVRLKVASRVVFGGMLYKKGEINVSIQPRWFVLFDELDGSVLRCDSRRRSRRSRRSRAAPPPCSRATGPDPFAPRSRPARTPLASSMRRTLSSLPHACSCRARAALVRRRRLRYYDGRNAVSRVHKGDIPISPHDVSMVRTFTHELHGTKRMGVRITTQTRVWELISYRSDTEARKWAELLNARIRRRVHRPTLSAMAESTEAQQAATIGSKEAGVVPQCTRL